MYPREVRSTTRIRTPKFNADLHRRADDVCEACWERHKERQWGPTPEDGQLEVVVSTVEGERTYHANSITALDSESGDVRLQLTSVGDLTKTFDRERVTAITLTEAQDIVYRTGASRSFRVPRTIAGLGAVIVG